MSDEQRQVVDARQVFEAYRETRALWLHSFAGSMRWVKRKGTEYLHAKRGKRERSLGRRSAETEAQFEAFVSGREDVRARLDRLSERLDRMAPVNRALDLGRLPAIAARIIRRLDDEELLGTHLLVIGTNALFAYEASAGVALESELLATGDADFLWDARQGIELVAPTVRTQGLLAILQKVDQSFLTRRAADFRAINADGYHVDLVRPESDVMARPLRRMTLGDRADDLEPSPIFGLHWLINAPRYESVAVGGDGYPVRIVAPDPRAFALHKLWVSSLAGRDPLKVPRDRSQAAVVAQLCHRYLRLEFDPTELQALPRSLRDLIVERPQRMRGSDDDPPEPKW